MVAMLVSCAQGGATVEMAAAAAAPWSQVREHVWVVWFTGAVIGTAASEAKSLATAFLAKALVIQ